MAAKQSSLGFTFGLILGAVAGTMAVVSADDKPGKQKIQKLAGQALKSLPVSKNTKQDIGDAISKAIQEAKQISQTLIEPETSKKPTPKPNSPNKRSFKRAGKKLT